MQPADLPAVRAVDAALAGHEVVRAAAGHPRTVSPTTAGPVEPTGGAPADVAAPTGDPGAEPAADPPLAPVAPARG